MQIQLIRHATLIIQMNTKRVMVDPMLCSAGEMPPIQNSTNDRRNPLVELPVSLEEVLPVDAVLITHMHRDHFDDTAAKVISKDTTILCQPVDEAKLKALGFLHILKIEEDLEWEGCRIIRTPGQHGTGEIGERMGPVSGFIIVSDSDLRLYIAGDTIYCPEIEQTLENYEPNVIVVNAGAAQFSSGSPITMTGQDVTSVCRQSKASHIVAVHMEAINHCLETRAQLDQIVRESGYGERIRIPSEGELLVF